MREAGVGVGISSHIGSSRSGRSSQLVGDYFVRRVPVPVIAYLALADGETDIPDGANGGGLALDFLAQQIEPVIIEEGELERGHMHKLLTDSLSSVDRDLLEYSLEKQLPQDFGVSLSVVVASRKKAFIGHVGKSRILLLHGDRLYDLTPTGGTQPGAAGTKTPEGEAEPKLFTVPGGEDDASAAEGAEALLGRHGGVRVLYNEVDLSPGDTVILCTDGLGRSVSWREIAEEFISSGDVQQSVDRLTGLASTRDPAEPVAVAAWRYPLEGKTPKRVLREDRVRKARARATDALLLTLLVLVLAGIFAVGIVFGWRITDALRNPQKESSGARTEKAERERIERLREKRNEGQAQTETTEVVIQAASVNGRDVRMRSAPDPNATVVGELRNGQSLSVLGQKTGADGRAWAGVKGTVLSGGRQVEAEGYVRMDFLLMGRGAATPQSTTTR